MSRLLLFLSLAMLAACGGGGGGDASEPVSGTEPGVLLSWSPAAGAAGYEVHWGRAPLSYEERIDVGAPAPQDGVVRFGVFPRGGAGVYYFALRAYDTEGRRSAFSNEIAYTLP